MVFGGRRYKCDNRTVMLNGAELHRANATVHLGHHISTDDNDSLVSAAIGQFWRGFNMFMADFSQMGAYIRTLSVIFSSYIAVHNIMVLHCGVCKVIWLADYV